MYNIIKGNFSLMKMLIRQQEVVQGLKMVKTPVNLATEMVPHSNKVNLPQARKYHLPCENTVFMPPQQDSSLLFSSRVY